MIPEGINLQQIVVRNHFSNTSKKFGFHSVYTDPASLDKFYGRKIYMSSQVRVATSATRQRVRKIKVFQSLESMNKIIDSEIIITKIITERLNAYQLTAKHIYLYIYMRKTKN